mgnify:CR=1 FL=1
MKFGDRLTLLRKEKGLTREALADILKISKYTLRNYELSISEPGSVFLKQVSEYFDVSIDYLMGMTDEKEKIKPYNLKASEYRNLDDYGRETVDLILERESQRTSTIADQAERIAELEQPSKVTQLPDRSYLEPNAAHDRTDIQVTDEMHKHDDALMKNDDEWK